MLDFEDMLDVASIWATFWGWNTHYEVHGLGKVRTIWKHPFLPFLLVFES